MDAAVAIDDAARVSEPTDVTREMTAMRLALGCGVTLAAGALTTFAALAGLIAARLHWPSLPPPIHFGWAFALGWVLFLVAAPAVGASAVVSPRIGRALDESAKRMGVGCAVPALMAVVGTLGALALVPVDAALHPGVGRPADYGQGIGIVLMLFCFATPLVGVVAAFFPRVGIALGIVLVLAFLGVNVAAMF